MRIAGVFLRDFEPIKDQLLVFPEKPKPELAEVHFFVGQNGTGKTRLLSLLAAACGNPAELTYRTTKTASAVSVDSTIVGNDRFRFLNPQRGEIFTDDSIEKLYAKFQKNTSIQNASLIQQIDPNKVVGMAFRSNPSLEDQPVTAMGEVKWGERDSFLRFSPNANENIQICQSLANLKVRMGIAYGDTNDRTVRMVSALDQTIKSVTDRELLLTVNYIGKEFRLRAKWGGKEVQLKQLPDGLRAIVGWLASCMVKLDMLFPDVNNPLEQPIILLLDEPDTYLHPAWQRKLIPAVQKLLPNAQIFIATHSPFVVSSVNHGWIHVFEADENEVVTIKEARRCGLGDSYIDVVEDILGVHEQFDPETEKLLKEFRSKREEFKKQPRDEKQLIVVMDLAKSIAERSQTLSFMMGREIAQIKTQLQQVAS